VVVRTRAAVAVGAVALVVVAACSSGSDGEPDRAAPLSSSPPPACLRPHEAGQSRESFDFDGVARPYELYVPVSYDGGHPAPVVFDFHGFGSNAVEQLAYSNFQPLADRDGFLIVAPEGQGEGAAKHFNLLDMPGEQDDVAMVRALLDHLEAQFCIDTRRVFSTGMSDGGAMTSVLACKAADRFAAFAAVAVILYVPPLCDASRAVAIEAFSGTADPIVPFNGGEVNCCGRVRIGAAPDAMAGWAAHDGCDPAFTDTAVGTEVTQRSWHDCAPGSDAVFYIIQGGGHTWPGAIPIDRLGPTTRQISATETIWSFFQAHPLP